MVKTLLHVHQGEQDSYNDSLHTDTSWKTGGSLLTGTSGLYGCGRVGWGEEREVQQMWDHCLCAVHIPENLGSNNPCDIRNHISEHHWLTEHKVDWDSVECVAFRTNYQRLTLETGTQTQNKNLWTDANNYLRLIHDLKRNLHTSTNTRRIENNSKTTDQSLQLLRFDDQSHHDKTDQSKPQPEA